MEEGGLFDEPPYANEAGKDAAALASLKAMHSQMKFFGWTD